MTAGMDFFRENNLEISNKKKRHRKKKKKRREKNKVKVANPHKLTTQATQQKKN
jgi:hypothetical protein